MRFTLAVAAGLLFAGMAAVPASADAPKAAYWRVETTFTTTHPRAVGSGYHLTQRRVSIEWLSPAGRSWSGFRELGARPATKKDEAAWRADGSPTTWDYRTEGMKIHLSTRPGKGSVQAAAGRPDGFRLGERYVTYQQLQVLPTEPETLRKQLTAEVNAWIDEAAEEAKSTAPKAAKNDWLVNLDRYVAERAVELLYVNPAPDKVRAAAYHVLKTTKGVSDLGRSKDPLGRAGQKLALPVSSGKGPVLRQQLLVDTTTMTLLAEYTDLGNGGKKVLGKSGVKTFEAGWTDDKPAVPDAR
ncbi:hypothetical protein [Nonomuraea gerenzanensis]|uniref:Uncharacterized protein n=1 Tax=Nonomuraea gerenzanensis TaxID=93944 RepID=A0A1M4DY01_9ACTN|nr:hypothetical protein [Nonomuraea gerenzanensis]UBU13783.1 hypothetical protein LCN96_01710 [Nonomuraea gerenzanensis]SBO91454.1 hypothetical protein BN4615_P968 [Nonomuraea gerenzanensis]